MCFKGSVDYVFGVLLIGYQNVAEFFLNFTLCCQFFKILNVNELRTD